MIIRGYSPIYRGLNGLGAAMSIAEALSHGHVIASQTNQDGTFVTFADGYSANQSDIPPSILDGSAYVKPPAPTPTAVLIAQPNADMLMSPAQVAAHGGILQVLNNQDGTWYILKDGTSVPESGLRADVLNPALATATLPAGPIIGTTGGQDTQYAIFADGSQVPVASLPPGTAAAAAPTVSTAAPVPIAVASLPAAPSPAPTPSPSPAPSPPSGGGGTFQFPGAPAPAPGVPPVVYYDPTTGYGPSSPSAAPAPAPASGASKGAVGLILAALGVIALNR